MFNRTIGFLFKLVVFGLAFGIGLLFLLRFDEWAGGFRKYLFATGNYEYLVYLIVFFLGVGYIVKWLIKAQFHNEFIQRLRRRRP